MFGEYFYFDGIINPVCLYLLFEVKDFILDFVTDVILGEIMF